MHFFNNMKQKYDFVFLTNTPSFYKINLCREIAKEASILIIFLGYASEAVNVKDLDSEDNLEVLFLSKKDCEKRSKIKIFYSLCILLHKIKYKKLLYSGWLIPEYNLLSFFFPKNKNCVINESSIIECSLKGWKGLIKKCIINRMSVALPSGELQKEIFDKIDFTGEVHLTHGVGIFNKQEYTINRSSSNNNAYKYLYVGRLVEVKNLMFLIDSFNKNGKSLTVVGDGELKEALKKMANSNIRFMGFVDNVKLKDVYLEHDIFILPSSSEVWGLVLEEAIYYGLPVLVSNRVGSYVDLVKIPQTGKVFDFDNQSSLNDAICELEDNYSSYKKEVAQYDFEKRDFLQVRAYLDLIK